MPDELTVRVQVDGTTFTALYKVTDRAVIVTSAELGARVVIADHVAAQVAAEFALRSMAEEGMHAGVRRSVRRRASHGTTARLAGRARRSSKFAFGWKPSPLASRSPDQRWRLGNPLAVERENTILVHRRRDSTAVAI